LQACPELAVLGFERGQTFKLSERLPPIGLQSSHV